MRNLFFLFNIALFLAACSNAPEPKAGASAEQPAVETPEAVVPEPAVLPEAPQTTADTKAPEEYGSKKSIPKKAGKVTVKSAPKPAARPEIADRAVLEEAATMGAFEESVAPAPALQRTPVTAPLRHEAFEQLLQQYVSDAGKVDYKGLTGKKAVLDTYCQALTENPPLETWSRDETLAFWINAYNAFTLKLIVDNYPTRSITKLDGGKPWDVRRIKIGSNKYSLNNIENDIIRPKFKEPRIHFAVNCAAQSCPPLWNHAYTAENLETTLESRTRAFINNSDFNTLTGNRARVSKIFDWYGADFGDLRTYLNKYAENPLEPNASIRFNEYNWDLND